MSFFGKLFGRKDQPEPPRRRRSRPRPPDAPPPLPPLRATVPTPDPAAEKPALIQVFDAYGREMHITREQWRDNILLGNLPKLWNDPEPLANTIIQSLNDGFFQEMVAPAEQLLRIDPNHERAATLLGIVYLKVGRLRDAEQVLTRQIQQHGESGVVLTNLAKVYAEQGNTAQVMPTLWHALELDPNQDNGLGWFGVLHREQGGETAELDAFRRVAALPDSWRAQLWLARAALTERRLDDALALHRESLQRGGTPSPADQLMQISGDLGNFGHLPELLTLVEPRYDAGHHGLAVGNNLIKAHLDLGQIDAARELVNQLHALKRPDWAQPLGFWDTEIAKARIAVSNPLPQGDFKVALLSIEGPVWLPPASPALELFPVPPEPGPVVAFLGGSATLPDPGNEPSVQLSNTSGRLSRALPLFLAEQTHLGTDARAVTLVPWLTEGGSGFVLAGVPMSDEEAAGHARQMATPADYAVVTHLTCTQEPWRADLRLIRTIDGVCLGTLTATFPTAAPEEGIPDLARRLLALLVEQAEAETHAPSALYQVPGGVWLGHYLLRLEQLLATRCAALDNADAAFLSGEREIIGGMLDLCLNLPGDVVPRLLLAHAVRAMKKIRPNIVTEFEDRLALLQKEKPLEQPAQAVAQRIFDEATAA